MTGLNGRRIFVGTILFTTFCYTLISIYALYGPDFWVKPPVMWQVWYMSGLMLIISMVTGLCLAVFVDWGCA